MREILFRGKRTDNGKWIEGCYIKSVVKNNVFAYITPSYPTEPITVYAKTISQFTGLTDKNGKKIFEGDIVEGLDFTAEDGGYGVVAFNDGAFEVVGICYNNIVGTFHENYYGRDFEVIGNIHDNPELMKGGVEE